MSQRRGGDPYWLRAKYPSKCSRCARQIAKGEQVFYYPNTRSVLCDADPCGKQGDRDKCESMSHTWDSQGVTDRGLAARLAFERTGKL